MKNRKINPYLKHLFKENLIYFVGAMFFIAIFLYFNIIVLRSIKEEKKQIETLREEVENLKMKKKQLSSMDYLNEADIVRFKLILTQLVPNTEDFFSILYALETLSQQTGVEILNYTLQFNKKRRAEIPIVVTLLGDQDSFMKLLKDYNFKSGRLITMSSFNFNGIKTSQLKLTFTFYNDSLRRNNIGENFISKKDYEFLKKISKKITVDLKGKEPGSLPLRSSDEIFK